MKKKLAATSYNVVGEQLIDGPFLVWRAQISKPKIGFLKATQSKMGCKVVWAGCLKGM
jgi:hypothetical protein